MYGRRLQTNLQYPVVSARYNNERDLAPEDGQRFALDCDAAYGFPGVVIRLLELPSINSLEKLELWVELYDRGHQIGVDSCKCSDLDEAIDCAYFLTDQARQQSRGISAILFRAITSESIAT